MITDPIANCLTNVRNAMRAKKTSVTLPSSKMVESILTILQRQKFLESFKTFSDREKKYVRVHLKYGPDKTPAFRVLRRISKPGLRRYVDAHGIPRVLNGMGMAVISTSKGMMSDTEARRAHVGGEVICEVW